MDYIATDYEWRGTQNGAFGPTSLVLELANTSTPADHIRFTTFPEHKLNEDGSIKYWSITKLFVDFCTTSGCSEEGFWLWLIPDNRSRDLFMKHKKLDKEMAHARTEVKLHKLAELECMAWVNAAGGRATYFKALCDKYGLTPTKTTDTKQTSEQPAQSSTLFSNIDLGGLLDEANTRDSSSH